LLAGQHAGGGLAQIYAWRTKDNLSMTTITHRRGAERGSDMAAEFATVDEYIGSFPDEVQDILREVRRTIQAAVPDAGERISYRIAAFTLAGRDLIYFAGWRHHLSVYPVPTADQALAAELAPHLAGRGTLKFPFGQPVPYPLIGRVAAALAGQRGQAGQP
jgi:uncharacterized protein YdhG (YjbR/CyaY superfamily)